LAVISQGILFEAKGIKYLKNKGGSYIRFKTFIIAVLLLIVLFASCAEKAYVSEGFIHINQVIPDVVYDIRYSGHNNFVGARIDGYNAPMAILTVEAAAALKDVSEEVDSKGYNLKIFDGYRPQKAVDHFIRWAEDAEDIQMKPWYYPNIDKKDLFRNGYIAKKSAHSRGSTIDLTLVYKNTGTELDMGSSYDFLDPISAHDSTLVSTEQAANRKILKEAMENHGFRSYYKEWWHYTLVNEPYPDTYFNFDVE